MTRLGEHIAASVTFSRYTRRLLLGQNPPPLAPPRSTGEGDLFIRTCSRGLAELDHLANICDACGIGHHGAKLVGR